MTRAQKVWLRRLGEKIQTSPDYMGWGNATFEKVMGNLCKLGYAEPYVHGGYQITDAGREALRGLKEPQA